MTADLDKLGEFDGYQNGAPGAAGTIAVPLLAATVRFSNTQPATRRGFAARYWTDFDWPRGGRMCISADGRDQRDYNPISASFPSRVLETNEVLSTLWASPMPRRHLLTKHTAFVSHPVFWVSMWLQPASDCWSVLSVADEQLPGQFVGVQLRLGYWDLHADWVVEFVELASPNNMNTTGPGNAWIATVGAANFTTAADLEAVRLVR